MDEKPDYKYILFPLPLLQEIFKKPKTGFQDIFFYGIYRSALTIKIHTRDAIRQAIYCYYHGELPDYLIERFNRLKIEDFNSGRDGFDPEGLFDPADEIEVINNQDDPELIQDIEEFYYLYLIKKVLNLRFIIEKVIHTYHTYNKHYGHFPGQPLVMIATKTMLEFTLNEKTEFEKVLFAAYAGIRSLIGRKQFTRTTKEMIFCRMYGAKNKKALPSILEDKKVKAIYNRYNSRYQKDKIVDQLLARHFLTSKIYYQRSLYISTKLDFDELAKTIAEYMNEKDINSRIKINKIKELEAKKKILQHLNKSTDTSADKQQ